MKIILLAFSVILALFQNTPVSKMTDSQRDGFAGPVRKAFEESSPLAKASDVPIGTRCRRQTRAYDAAGRLTLVIDYPGSCGNEEIVQRYTYDRDGSQFEEFDDSRASGIGPSQPHDDRVVSRHVFKYDDRNRQITQSVYSAGGKLSYVVTDFYDEQDRLIEWHQMHSGNTTGKTAFAYEGLGRFPVSCASFGSDGRRYSVTRNTEYELNARGDWTKRKETHEPIKGPKSVDILCRTIDYY